MATALHPASQQLNPQDLLARIDAALSACGKDPQSISVDDLSCTDAFHIGGTEATQRMAFRARITDSDKVLDLHGGLGGPARKLVEHVACQVTVLGKSAEYCRAGEELCRRTGTSESTRFVEGDASRPQFADSWFDVVWMQRPAVEFPSKHVAYPQIARVLKPRGKLVVHEIVATRLHPIVFHSPWSRPLDLTRMLPAEELRALIRQGGLREIEWHDVTVQAREWFDTRAQLMQEPAELHLETLLGRDAQTAFDSMRTALAADTIRVIEAVFVKM